LAVGALQLAKEDIMGSRPACPVCHPIADRVHAIRTIYKRPVSHYLTV
jgi:hypothetical protein